MNFFAQMLSSNKDTQANSQNSGTQAGSGLRCGELKMVVCIIKLGDRNMQSGLNT